MAYSKELWEQCKHAFLTDHTRELDDIAKALNMDVLSVLTRANREAWGQEREALAQMPALAKSIAPLSRDHFLNLQQDYHRLAPEIRDLAYHLLATIQETNHPGHKASLTKALNDILITFREMAAIPPLAAIKTKAARKNEAVLPIELQPLDEIKPQNMRNGYSPFGHDQVHHDHPFDQGNEEEDDPIDQG
jgi:hypothetical protein